MNYREKSAKEVRAREGVETQQTFAKISVSWTVGTIERHSRTYMKQRHPTANSLSDTHTHTHKHTHTQTVFHTFFLTALQHFTPPRGVSFSLSELQRLPVLKSLKSN